MGTNDTSNEPTQIHNVKWDDNNVPAPYRMFRRWYNSHRGSWSEVEQAAQRNPQVKALLDSAKQFNGYTGQGKLGDQLEAAVKQVLPKHGHQDPAGMDSDHGQGSHVFGQGSSIEARLKALEARLKELESRVR